MTLLSIVQDVAKNVGLTPPNTAQSDDPDAIKLVQFVNETGLELSRRVNWNALTFVHRVTATGLDQKYALPADFSRLSDGLCVNCDGTPVRGGLTADEWFSLTPEEGDPRFFRLLGKSLGVYPYPEVSQLLAVSYISSQWAHDVSNHGIVEMSKDNDEALIPSALIARGAVWRFLRHVGKDFSDHLAEYEAMLLDHANAEAGERQP